MNELYEMFCGECTGILQDNFYEAQAAFLDAADSLAGEFISVGDAIARVENKKRIDAALEYSADIVYFNYM